VIVAIGKSGREEITESIRHMAFDKVPPEQVNEKMLESYLTFKYCPDIVVKSGGDHLTDFLIWQSVYAELFFSDVNWIYFRKVGFGIAGTAPKVTYAGKDSIRFRGDFNNDGVTDAMGPTVQHTFDTSGVFTVRLT
jgi:hypothetical protein